ncbi:MAG TPA: hypothetical protein VGB50_13430 [Flavobacterium sp.]|jgi:hypothetical protein
MKDIYLQIRGQRYFYPIVYGFMALICAYLLFPSGFEAVVMPSQPSEPWWYLLDSSWVITLNYIKVHGLQWGTDFVFTYGPLGQIATRYGWGESRYLFLFADLFLLLNYSLIFYFSLKRSANKYLTAALIVLLTLFLPVWIGNRISLFLLLFLAFWIRESIGNKSVLPYAMQISILVICFFIKFNSALISLPLYYMGIFYMIYARRLKAWEIVAYSLLPLLLIYIFSFNLNVSIYNYIRTGFDLISGYNEIMYEDYPLPHTWLYVIAVALIVTSIIAVNFYKSKDNFIKKAVIAVLLAVPFFVAFKQGFVRSNPDYNSDFFACTLIYFVTASDLHYQIKSKVLNVLLLMAALTSIHFLYIKREKPFEIADKFSKGNYIRGFQGFSPDSDHFFRAGGTKFPDEVLKKIGNQTVDAYPWNIRMLHENNLNYQPRPIIQAYSSYTRFLEDLNFELYNSEKAPAYVIYEYNTLDNRYPLFDESKVNVALKLNYEVDQLFDYNDKKLLLLKKKANFKKIRFEKTREYALMLNSPLIPKPGVYYEVELYNDLMGKLFSIIRHAPDLTLQIKVKDGQTLDFKTSNKLLQSGLYEDNFIEKTEDFADIVTSGHSHKKAGYYNFKPRNTSFFKEKIRITEYKIIH